MGSSKMDSSAVYVMFEELKPLVFVESKLKIKFLTYFNI